MYRTWCLGAIRRKAGVVATLLGGGVVWFGLASPPPVHAAYPGANGKIAFQRAVVCPDDPNADCTHIWTMNPDGSGQADLEPSAGSATAAGDQNPAWNQDSTKLAFASTDGLSVMNSDGTGRRLLTDIASPYQSSWSPTSIGKIAFSDGCCGTSGDIHTINVDGTGEATLTNGQGVNTDPAWQPSGALIAFASDGAGGVSNGPGIYVLNPNNAVSTATRIVPEPANWPVWTSSPDWSPDGTQLVFDADDANASHIYVVNADGTNLHIVATPTLDPDFFHPHWSPDGTKITFDADGPNTVDLWVMDASGANQTDVTNYAATVVAQYPAWGSSAASGGGGGGGATTTTTTTTAPGATTTTTTAPGATTTTTRATTTTSSTTTSTVFETNCSPGVLSASPSTVAAGGQTTVTGLCLDPNQTASVSLSNNAGGFDQIASVATDPDGRFAAAITIPATATNGSHLLLAATSSRNATTSLNVIGGPTVTTAPGTKVFAVTGRNSGGLVVVGLALIFAGIVLVAGGRIAELPIDL